MALTFLVFSRRQTSVTREDKKLLALSVRNILGAPCHEKISSTNMCAIIGASMDGTENASGHFVT